MNRPTIVRMMLPPPLEDAVCVGSDELPRFKGVFSPEAALMLAVLGVSEPAAIAVAAGITVRAPTITTPRISVSDLFIEGRLRGRVLPIIGRGGRYLREAGVEPAERAKPKPCRQPRAAARAGTASRRSPWR